MAARKQLCQSSLLVRSTARFWCARRLPVDYLSAGASHCANRCGLRPGTSARRSARSRDRKMGRRSSALSSKAIAGSAARRCRRASSRARAIAYSEEALRRDFQALWNTQYFEDIRLEVQDSPNRPNSKIVIFHLVERPIIRRIEYRGIKVGYAIGHAR